MKKSLLSVLIVAVALSVTMVCSGGQDVTGNGAPSGPHYNLNIIGVPKGKTATMDGDNGHRIFVPLYGNAKIYLTEAVNFSGIQVIDANGTDSNGATFALPNPDPDGDGVTRYSVYVRALGKPGGQAVLQSCYTDAEGTWCAADIGLNDGVTDVTPIVIERKKGKSTFENVTKDLLYVDYCTDWVTALDGTRECTTVQQIPLFSNDTLGYLWDYDNTGMKLAQLRFYEVPTSTGW